MCAGSTVFVRNVIGDMMMCDAFHDMEVALYYLWYSRDLGATADGRHAGDAPKGLLERSPSGLPKNFQCIDRESANMVRLDSGGFVGVRLK